MANLDADIVIVGTGLAGAATAYHLAHRADVRVLLIEREALPGEHASGRNAAIVRPHASDPVMRRLVVRGAAHLCRGELARFERRGLMLLGLGDQDVRRLCPLARGNGLWLPEGGTVDVAGLLRTYLAGQEVHFNTRVFGWSRRGETCRVMTSRGEIVCGIIVNAAGAWAGELGGLPLTPMNRHLFVTIPMEHVDPGWPCVWDTDGGLYFRPESGGLLLSVCDERNADPGDYREDSSMVDCLADKVATLQPALGELTIGSTWVGQRTFAADRRFVVGFDPRDDRVFHVAGLGGQGVTASYAIGRMAAELLMQRAAPGNGALSVSRLFHRPNLGKPRKNTSTISHQSSAKRS